LKNFLLLLFMVSLLSLQAAAPDFPAKVPEDMPKKLSSDIARIIRGGDTVRANAVRSLGKMGNSAIPAAPWITPLLTDRTSLMYIYIGGAPGSGSRTTMAAVAADALSRIFKDKPNELIALYKRKDIANRPLLIPLLGSFNTPEANAVYAGGFSYSDEKIRVKTADAAKNPRWKDELFKLLANDSSQNVRSAAAKALKRFDKAAGDEISNGFAPYLFDKNSVVRVCAMGFMAGKKDPRGLKAIEKITSGSDFRGARDCAPFAFEYGSEGLKVLNNALKSNPGQALGILGSSSFSNRLVKAKDMDLILTVAGLVGSPDNRVSYRAGLIMHDIKRDYPRINQDDFKKDPAAREKFESAIRSRIIEALLPVLDNGSRNAVDSAINNLTAWKCVDQRLIAPTVKLLGNKDYTIRNNASSLLRLQGKAAVPELIKAAGTGDPATKTAAMNALTVAGCSEAVPVLIKNLSDSGTDVRKAAASALGVIGDRKALEALQERLNDPDPSVAGTAVNALKKLGIKDAKPGLAINDGDLKLVLGYYINSRNQGQRYSVQKKLEAYSLKNPEKFSALLAGADAKQLKALITVMAGAGGKNNNGILLKMLKDDKSTAVQNQVLIALKGKKNYDDSIIEVVMDMMLSNKSRSLAINAKELIGYMLNSPESKKTVYNICLETLNKGNSNYIKQVFELLNNRIDDPRFVKPLLALLDAKDGNVSHRAAACLKYLKNELKDDKINQQIDEKIMKSALPGLTSPDKNKCLTALNRLVLFNIKSPEVAEKVVPLAGSSDYQIKRAAAHLLSLQGDAATENIDAIAKKFSDSSGATLRAYGLMLIKSGKPEGIKIIGNAALTAKSPDDRKDCMALLLQSGKNREIISDYLYNVALKDRDPKIRLQAAYDLVRFWRGCRNSYRGAGEKEADANLKKLLEKGDQNQKSRILNEMSNSMDSSFKPLLEKISRGSDKGLKYYADRILQHMNRHNPSTVRSSSRGSRTSPAASASTKPKESLEDLIKQSTSTNTETRMTAVKGLAYYKEQSSTDALLARLYDPSRKVSFQACQILRSRGVNKRSPSYLKDPPANDKELAICIAALNERDSRIIRSAVGALTAKAKKDPDWFKKFSDTKDPKKLAPLIPIFAVVADEYSIEKILEFAGNSSSSISYRTRASAVNSLRNTLIQLHRTNKPLYEKALEGVIKIIKEDSNSSVRRSALKVLQYGNTSPVVKAAWPELAKSKDPYVAGIAKRYLPKKK
jgi:HEAT repeat protein